MSKYLSLLLLVLTVSVASAYAQDNKFTVGLTLPMSGPFAEFGAAVKNALTLVEEEQPETMQYIRIVSEDDQYNSKIAISAFHKLKDGDKADIILSWGNEPALALSPLAESLKYPLLAFGQTPAIAAERTHVVRILGPADRFGTPTGEYLRNTQRASVQVVLVDNSFYRLVSDSIHKGLGEGAKYSIVATVSAAETDFRATLIRIKQNPQDAVGVLLAPGQLIPFFKQANELRLKNFVFGSTSFESKAVATEARELMRDSVYAHVNVVPAWHDKYLQKFGDDIQVSYAAVFHDTILQLAQIVKRLGSDASGHNVLSAFSELPEQHGAAGVYRAKKSAEHGTYIDFEVVLKRISEGRAQVVQ